MNNSSLTRASVASRALSSLAVSCLLTLVALLVLTLGMLQNSLASGVSRLSSSAMPATSLPGMHAAVKPVAFQAKQPRMTDNASLISTREVKFRGAESPARQMFGLSKVAFPLLVSDVVPVDVTGKAVVLSGITVGVR